MSRNNVGTDARPHPIFDGLESLDNASGTSAAGLGISAPSNFNFQEMSKKRRKKKRKNKSAKQSGDHKDSGSSADGDAVESASISNSSTHTGATGAYEVESDNDSDNSSATMGRPTPPVSPMMLTPSKRKLIEQRSTEEHIVSPRAPRNRHVKKKSYSRVASSATAPSAQDVPPSPITAATATEVEQQRRLLQLYQMEHKTSNGDGDGDDDTPSVLMISLPTDDEGNNLQVHLIHRYTLRLPNAVNRTKIYEAVRAGNARGGDNVAIALEAGETTEEEQTTKSGVAEDDSA
jgi:hypothetical protein